MVIMDGVVAAHHPMVPSTSVTRGSGVKPSCFIASVHEARSPPSASADRVSGQTFNTERGSVELPAFDVVGPPAIDIFKLAPDDVLKLMCAHIVDLVLETGDVLITPLPNHLISPDLRTVTRGDEGSLIEPTLSSHQEDIPLTPNKRVGSDEIDALMIRGNTIGSPEASATEASTVIGANAESTRVQHEAIVRKFYSKRPPPISLEEYILRIHRYCPMSTAVFLAASLYIDRLANAKRVLHVTPRNAHRLLLATLRIAVKALEDRSYPHRRFAKVGGVSEAELKRLEISFCFVINFDLKVNEEMLSGQAVVLRAAQRRRLEDGLSPVFPTETSRR